MQTIRKGSRGEDVKTLQKALNLYVDGIFGVLTDEAVREFQKANRLVVDGIVGTKTWAALGVVAPCGRNIKEIIVHYTATPEGEDYTVEQIRDWHVNGNGWSDIGYHWVIYRDGSIHAGRPEHISGAHCTNHNSVSIGVCYVGGCPPRSVQDWNGKSKDTRTGQQKLALVKLLRELKRRYPDAKIYPHSKFANKPCPGFDAEKEYRNLK